MISSKKKHRCFFKQLSGKKQEKTGCRAGKQIDHLGSKREKQLGEQTRLINSRTAYIVKRLVTSNNTSCTSAPKQIANKSLAKGATSRLYVKFWHLCENFG